VRFRQGCGLTINGRLLADGAQDSPITFTRYPGDTTWERLKFIDAGDSRLTHCIIEYCNSVGDHKDYYPVSCGPPPVFAARNYHEAVVVLASHVEFDGCSFTNLPDASAAAEGDALAIISDDADHPGTASATVRNSHFIHIGQGVHTRYAYVLVEGCDFRDKHGDNDDVDLYGESTPVSIIRSNRFLYPSYDDRINPTRSSALIYGNTIYGSTDHGIVLRDVGNPVVFNNVLYACSAGGICVQNGCEALILNNTLVNCPSAIKMFDHLDRIAPPYCLTPASGKATLANNIIWNSTPAFNLAGNAFGTLYTHVSYSDIQGGTSNASLGTKGVLMGGPGNFNLDPRFANSASTNFHLTAGSPCIDAGTNLAGFMASDFESTPRPLDGNGVDGPAFDVGAYEFLLAAADSNNDGIPDGWCQRFGFSPLAGEVANGDTDLDGVVNSGEYVADTNPTNALSYFHIQSIADAPLATVFFASSTNRQYTLYYSTNLATGIWASVPGQQNVRAVSETMALTDTNSLPENYYRVRVSVPSP
jgi:parallel beta-helix repeat protein